MITSRIYRFDLPLVIVFLSISLLHLNTYPKIPQSSPPQNRTLTLAPRKSNPYSATNHSQPQVNRSNFIVRFHEYKLAQIHKSYLEERVKLGGWRWIERRNPAEKFPTDFGVVAIEESVMEVLIEEFRKLRMVKDVWKDSSYRRGLFGKKKKRNGRVGAFVDGKKRPGKIFTAMSFSEGDGENYATTSNLSISWNRHLLMQSSYPKQDAVGEDDLRCKGGRRVDR